ncbi:MAG: hypothetical protein J6Y92_07055 [Lentisphaeria bacterium]|nr:hypothetical protein [Lentisphaeria bacterium]
MGFMKHFRRALPVVMTFVAAFVCGAGMLSCNADEIDRALDPENFDISERPLEGVIEIQEIITLRRGTDKEIMAPTMFGDDICVNKAILLDSADVKKIKAIPIEKQPPYYSLELKLTDRGRRHWIGLSLPNRGSHVAFIIDGIVYRTFVPRLLYDDVTDSIIVDGPFDPTTAKKLEANSNRNYFLLK